MEVDLSDSKCTFIVDTGSDISIVKANKVKPTQIFYAEEKCIISGIGQEGIHSLGSTFTYIRTENIQIEHKFHIVDDEFPIPTDGIIGRDFLTRYKCSINYEPWLLTFTVDHREISIPIEDNFRNQLFLPPRH